MTEENADKCEPESGDMMKNSGLTMEEATAKDIEERGSESLKRNSSVTIVGPDHKFTVQSRYRSVSIGSCHDLCKPGLEHELENVTKRPLLGTIRESRPLVPKPLRRRLSLPGPIPERSSLLPTKGTNFPKRRSQSTMRRMPSETKLYSVPTFGNAVSRSKINYPAVKKTMHVNSSQKVEENKTKDACSLSGSRKVKAKEPMSKSPRTPLEKSPSKEGTLCKNRKSFSSSSCRSNLEDSKFNKSRAVFEKSTYMVKSNVINTGKALRSSLRDEESSSTREALCDGETNKSVASSGRWASRPKGENRQISDSINAKATGIATKEGGSKTDISRAKGNVSLQTKAEGTSICQPDEKEGSALMVKFRSGSVVNAQVASNPVRKLQFKRGRILGEDQSAEVGDEKSLKSGNRMANEVSDTRPEPKKVHLRRQETSGKKDSIDLNNVIEETASKLVKMRNSKVKALVGAFETVMSIRDREPLPETNAS
ncbi:uncharacterized protein LOC141638678 isoform X2 [Silene latifolia]